MSKSSFFISFSFLILLILQHCHAQVKLLSAEKISSKMGQSNNFLQPMPSQPVVKNPESTDQYCKHADKGVCLECFYGYFVNPATKICKKLNPLCKKANMQNGFCTQCYSGYGLNQKNGNCQFFQKDASCKYYSLTNKQQCAQCIERFYLNTKFNKCTQVHIYCKKYNKSNGQCFECYRGYILRQNKCILADNIDTKCKKFNSFTQSCEQCYNGYYNGNKGKCEQANPLCKTYQMKTGKCTSCFMGYQFQPKSGICRTSERLDKFCKESIGQTCNKCYSGYVLINGKCSLQNPDCKTVTSSGACQTCWPGYEKVGQTCKMGILLSLENPSFKDQYCSKYNNNKCIQCYKGYFLSQTSQKCQIFDPMCVNHNLENGDCIQCSSGFILEENKCIRQITIEIPFCQQYQNDPTICQQCMEGYYLSNNMCSAVSILCVGYDKDSGECKDCMPGYFLQQGQCIFPAIFDSNCLTYQSSYCSTCRPGYFLLNFGCQSIDRNCFRFNFQKSECEQCVNGLSPNGYLCQ